MRVKPKFLLPREWPWGIDYQTFTRRLSLFPLPGVGVEIEFGPAGGEPDTPAPLDWSHVSRHYGAFRPKVVQFFPWRNKSWQQEMKQWDVHMLARPEDRPHLRSLSSLTPSEAVELIEATTGRGFYIGDPEELLREFHETQVFRVTRLRAAMMQPQGLNFLLTRGFNIFDIPHFEAPAPAEKAPDPL
jgi:hypothetical protein